VKITVVQNANVVMIPNEKNKKAIMMFLPLLLVDKTIEQIRPEPASA